MNIRFFLSLILVLCLSFLRVGLVNANETVPHSGESIALTPELVVTHAPAVTNDLAVTAQTGCVPSEEVIAPALLLFAGWCEVGMSVVGVASGDAFVRVVSHPMAQVISVVPVLPFQEEMQANEFAVPVSGGQEVVAQISSQDNFFMTGRKAVPAIQQERLRMRVSTFASEQFIHFRLYPLLC